MATIYEVSKLAGVSLATVSRVMNNNANVSDATRKKVTLAMEELGYRPNSIAQSLASNCSNSAGLLVSELKGPFYGPMMSGIETAEEELQTTKSPRYQVKTGIASTDVVCKENFELLLKTSNGSPACIKESNIEKLIQRGWGTLA